MQCYNYNFLSAVKFRPINSKLVPKGLPESETELDNLTEFNTAHNRRITMIGIPAEQPKKKRKIKLTFDEDEQVINPEDVDPSVGRFRNMVESTVIPKKRPHSAGPGIFQTDIGAFPCRKMYERYTN